MREFYCGTIFNGCFTVDADRIDMSIKEGNKIIYKNDSYHYSCKSLKDLICEFDKFLGKNVYRFPVDRGSI